jgi:hypothetical protein
MKKTIYELVSDIKKQEQSELIEVIKTYGTSKTDGSIVYVFQDESPVVAGYSYDEPSDLVITQVGVTPKGHLFIVGTEKNVGFVPQNIQPDDIFAGHIEVITSEIIARAKVK